MLISVIVPVRNEAANIRQTLLGLAQQDFPTTEYEVLVVDGRSEDGTLGVVWDLQRTIPNLHLFDNPQRLASAGRNFGVKNSRGKYVVIVDGHCRITDRSFLANLVEAFETSGADTLGRPQPLAADTPTPFQRAVSAARASWLGHNPDSAIYLNVARFLPADNVAVAYRREVFDKIGLFDVSFDACEDVEFNTRVRLAGLTCYFTPAIAVAYQPRAGLRGLAYQLARYGRGRAKLGRKHPGTVSIASLVPPLWLIWLVTAAILSIVWSPAAWAFVGTVAAYLLAVSSESVRLWLTRSGAPLTRLPLVFAAIHAGFGWGYLTETAAWLPTWPAILRRGVARRFRFRAGTPAA